VAEAAFGMQLRQSRQAAALSLRQLATRVGYDHSYLSQVERGQRPGSTQLAQLCDRELNTGTTLTAAYLQLHSQEVARTGRLAGPSSGQSAAPAGVDVLEVARHGLASTFGAAQPVNEWAAVISNNTADFHTTPPAELLPEFMADLQLLRTDTSAALAAPAAELSVLIALTLTAMGQIRAAGRWWRTSRMTADGSGEPWTRSLVRGWEATSALSEHRPLPDLLHLADEALVLAGAGPESSGQPSCGARALAARALVLARLGRGGDAHEALRELLGLAGDLPAEVGGTTSVFGWAAYKLHAVEGSVCCELGYTGAGYVVLERALELCPVEHVGERAGFELGLARCLVLDGEVAAGLAMAMRVLVELPDQWHTHYLYDAAGRVLSAVQGKELGRAAVRDYRELLTRRPYLNRSVGSGSSSAWAQG
jgi:transcriptional regulator with XRE-family HTH domain